jgi:hypothetical protein
MLDTYDIVESDFGPRGRAFTETDIDRADLESTIADLIAGQHGDPMRVIGFNTAARWSEDASADIAREIRRRFDLLGQDVPLSHSGLCRTPRWPHAAADAAPCVRGATCRGVQS